MKFHRVIITALVCLSLSLAMFGAKTPNASCNKSCCKKAAACCTNNGCAIPGK